MIAAAWVLAGFAGALVMMTASRAAVRHAVALASAFRLPPFLVGVTLMAIGTDTPELVNSIVSSYLGHGDINVGDSVGSVFTQATLILGLLPFIGGVVAAPRRDMFLIAGMTAAALLVGCLLLGDGFMSRLDALLLAVLWLAATLALWRYCSHPDAPQAQTDSKHNALKHVALALLALAITGAGAALLVKAIVAIATLAGMPEYILSFFVASLGTSLPELAVEYTALRRGERAIALGDLLGACLIDGTLSIAAGPALFPITLTAPLALRGLALAIAAMVVAGLLLGTRGKHDKRSGVALIALYFVAYFVLLVP